MNTEFNQPCSGTEGSSCNKNNNCTFPKCKWEKEAERIWKNVPVGGDVVSEFAKAMQLGYEKGRDKAMEYYGKMDKKHFEELQQQLAEKDVDIEKWRQNNRGFIGVIARLEQELTAAREEIERLKNK